MVIVGAPVYVIILTLDQNRVLVEGDTTSNIYILVF